MGQTMYYVKQRVACNNTATIPGGSYVPGSTISRMNSNQARITARSMQKTPAPYGHPTDNGPS